MLSQPDPQSNEAPRSLTVLMEELVDIRAECFGATHHPVRLSVAAVVSALVLMATLPPTSAWAIGAVVGFLLLAIHLLFVADGALERSASGAGRS